MPTPAKVLMLLGNAGLEGSELHTLDLARHLRKRTPFEIEFCFLRNGPMIDVCKNEMFITHCLSKPWLPHLTQLIRSSQYAIVHAHQPVAKFYGALSTTIIKALVLFTSAPKTRYFITIHTAPVAYYNIYKQRRPVFALFAFARTYLMQTVAVLSAEKVFTVSKIAARPWGCIRKRFIVSYGGIPEILESKSKSTDIQDFRRREPWFLYCGGDKFNKGYDIVLSLARQNPGFTFKLAGRFSKVNEHPGNQLIYLDEVSPEKLWEQMGKASAVVIPSRFETFCRIALEAAVLLCPVVANRTGGIPEVLSSDECFFCSNRDISSFKNALEKLQNDPGRAFDMAIRAHKSVKSRFKLETTMGPVILHYKRALS